MALPEECRVEARCPGKSTITRFIEDHRTSAELRVLLEKPRLCNKPKAAKTYRGGQNRGPTNSLPWARVWNCQIYLRFIQCATGIVFCALCLMIFVDGPNSLRRDVKNLS